MWLRFEGRSALVVGTGPHSALRRFESGRQLHRSADMHNGQCARFGTVRPRVQIPGARPISELRLVHVAELM